MLRRFRYGGRPAIVVRRRPGFTFFGARVLTFVRVSPRSQPLSLPVAAVISAASGRACPAGSFRLAPSLWHRRRCAMGFSYVGWDCYPVGTTETNEELQQKA